MATCAAIGETCGTTELTGARTAVTSAATSAMCDRIAASCVTTCEMETTRLRGRSSVIFVKTSETCAPTEGIFGMIAEIFATIAVTSAATAEGKPLSRSRAALCKSVASCKLDCNVQG